MHMFCGLRHEDLAGGLLDRNERIMGRNMAMRPTCTAAIDMFRQLAPEIRCAIPHYYVLGMIRQ